jgi:hypothetical protein
LEKQILFGFSGARATEMGQHQGAKVKILFPQAGQSPQP